MGERVTISYRGAAYELGRGKRSYGIWGVGAPRTEPVERWPETPEGWNAAWSRFTAIETPGNIVAARSASAGLAISASAGAAAAAAVLAIGILCGVVSLFPGYVGGSSLASQPPQLVPHVIYLATWTLSAVLILLGGARMRAGALLGLGTSIVTFGLFFADLGGVIAGGGHLADAGLWFGLVGWLACAAGSVMACWLGMGRAGRKRKAAADAASATPATADATPATADGTPATTAGGTATAAGGTATAAGGTAGPESIGAPGRPRGYEVARAALLILAGAGAAVAFAPSWDSYALHTSTGSSQTITAGYAFANPGAVIAGDLAVMIAFGLVVIAAAAWRPVRMGAMLLTGAIIPMAAQAISALVQVSEKTPPTQFGLSQSQASAIGLTITNGLTAAFWIFCLLVVVLVVSCAWMLITPPAPAAAATVPVHMPAAWGDGSHDDADDPWDTEDDEPGPTTEPQDVAGPHEAAEPHHAARPDDDADSVDFGKPAR
ncbi:MAG: hypothetical protein JO345_09930 [Streptosporangiaceae bacterium]|nr:hypothetical protein [Streptosporangiaceae bacterium]